MLIKFFIKNNKLGEEKIISIYWFLILILVAVGIFLMVNSFYNSPYDARTIESEILSEKIANCINSGGKFNQELMPFPGSFSENFGDSFLEECSLYLNSNNDKEVQYYFELKIYDKINPLKELFNVSKGNPNWKSDCYLEDEEHEKIVKCIERNFYASDDSGNIYIINILTMVRKTEQNVKL